jgi:hypothetical protein
MKLVADRQQTKEEEIERLALETARRIREAEPESRQQLVEMVSAIIREEARADEVSLPSQVERKPMNPLAGGIGLLLIGSALAFITPPIGLVLVVCGLIAVVWGVIISWVRK